MKVIRLMNPRGNLVRAAKISLVGDPWRAWLSIETIYGHRAGMFNTVAAAKQHFTREFLSQSKTDKHVWKETEE